MPELPETETIARDLAREVIGRTILGVSVRRPDVLREVTPLQFSRRLKGARIERSWRRAKLIVLDLSTGNRLAVQPRFTGGLLLDDGNLNERDRAYSTLDLLLDDGRRLHYSDVRRLGTVSLFSPERWAEYEGGLGVEPLDPEFSEERFSGILRGSRQAVKKVIMDQKRVVGVGNIYANEALWRAGIDPSREARSLSAHEASQLRSEIVQILEEAIEARGTSFRDYRDASGESGSFVNLLAVYGREGEPCRRCGRRLVGTHAIDGRATVLCVSCQQ
ncbi:MAG TPA: bifunctional DNA-formamidopyrimidine glycosylase/DNA-(apurinic or apyrimidinic site) lyase [Gemmatimonadales bacterium]|nr:bifunctional DNA-formamidopyrimidine glycosylase/DNA-(apurinic or apyrimidinic site) lyase [Gemmatimonadales bacterium]